MIISDLCDEYAVLVSQNKAPVYGYDNVNIKIPKFGVHATTRQVFCRYYGC